LGNDVPAFPKSFGNIRILLSAPSPRKVADVLAIRSSKLKLSRTHLKRPIRSFSIEIRKRPGRATGPGINARLFETKAPLSEFDRDSHRAAAAIFAPRSAVVAPIITSPSATAGRVLPVPVVDQPLNTEPHNDFSPEVESERESQTADKSTPRSRDGRASPSKSRILSAALPTEQPSVASDRPASAVEHSAKPRSDDGAKNSAPKRVTKESGNGKLARAQPPRASAPRSNSKPTALMEQRPASSSEDQAPTSLVVDLQSPSSNMNQAEPRIRKRAIWGRYVTGEELKPGERWKSRLRDMR
jgi:hypothetical protein